MSQHFVDEGGTPSKENLLLQQGLTQPEKVIIIGAGPCGLSAAVEIKKRGFDPLVIEKGPIVNSIYHYPTYLQFHSTPELLEIGGVPFNTPNEKPTRLEGLTYYRKVAERADLRIHTYETVRSIVAADGGFTVTTENKNGRTTAYEAEKVVVATGYFDHPNLLDIHGEELPKVSHYYKEAHPYAGCRVAIVGGNNSAIDAALELVRVGAEVTVIYRRGELSSYVKPWVRPIFESMVNKGRIRMMFACQLKEIREESILVETGGVVESLPNDFVFALTGFQPDRKLLESAGVRLSEETGGPVYHPDTMESNVPGLYIAGVVAAGKRANEIFIETGRLHGEQIARDLTKNHAYD